MLISKLNCLKNKAKVPMITMATSLVLLLGAQLPLYAAPHTITGYDPVTNDGEVGKTIISGGANDTINTAGDNIHVIQSGSAPGATDMSYYDLDAAGRIASNPADLDLLNVTIGSKNDGLSVPDGISGGNVTIQTYNNSAFSDMKLGDIVVHTYDDVGDQQYIGMRIGEIDSGGGTLGIQLGESGAVSTSVPSASSQNNIGLAAKQSVLFYADGTAGNDSILNWENNNRITFTAVSLNGPDVPSTVNYSTIGTYGGTFSVTDIDGLTTTHTVSDINSLKDYNTWLKDNLTLGLLDPNEYGNLFNLGVTFNTHAVQYKHLADDPNDDIFKPTGERTIMKASGANAEANLLAGRVLESENALQVIALNQGATSTIEAGAIIGNTNGHAINANDKSKVINDGGVINTNFVINTDSAGNHTYQKHGTTVGNAKGVVVQTGSSFENKGIINVASTNLSGAGNYTSGIYLDSNIAATDITTGVPDTKGQLYSAVNGPKGIINVGIVESKTNNTLSGVEITHVESSFANEGKIYIGRGPQFDAANPETVGDVVINKPTITSGILIRGAGGKAENTGTITIGKETQNAAGIFAAVENSTVKNSGTIEVKGKPTASPMPVANYGILAQNTGASSDISNDGIINLSGVNGIGIKAYSTAAGTPTNVTTTLNSIINVVGDTDPVSGTRNYGIWVEGAKGGESKADVAGQINLIGDGAIGAHARGKATINIDSANTTTTLSNGTKQIVFFAYGDDAKINISGAGINNLNASTDETTIFRMENGADFDDTVATPTFHLKTDGTESKAIVGTGNGTIINLEKTQIEVTGTDSVGLWLDGGATGDLKNAATLTMKGTGGIGAIVDSQKYDLTGNANPLGQGPNTVLTNQIKITDAAGATESTGVILRNSGKLINDGPGSIEFANGTDNTGVFLQNGGILENKSVIDINHGTGILMSGANAKVPIIGEVNVDDGTAGVRLTNNAKLASSDASNIINTNGTAHGILMDIGAQSLSLANAAINTLGTGNGIENTAETSKIAIVDTTINVNDGSGIRTGVVNVNGAGIGFNFIKSDGVTPTTGNLDLNSGIVFNVNAAGGIGINVATNGTARTAAVVNVNDAAGGAALQAGLASATLNTGILNSKSTVAPVVDLSNGTGTIFQNMGIINAATRAHNAVLGSAGNDNIFLTGGSVVGEVTANGGDDNLTFSGGTLDGGITMGANGTNNANILGVSLATTSHIVAGAGGTNALNMANIKHFGASMPADNLAKGVNLGNNWNSINFRTSDFTLTGNVVLDSSAKEAALSLANRSVLYAGNGVKPIIRDQSGKNDLTVRLAGGTAIDLTNGNSGHADTLTIKGNLSSGLGTFRSSVYLNEGGPLSRQYTDRFLIEGNASGLTVLDLVVDNAPGSDSGAFTDTNGNNHVDPNEGISVVQVAGTSAPNAFVLKNNYVASGAFAYTLNSFAPNASAAGQRRVGNTKGAKFWDYRLANKHIGPHGPSTSPSGFGGHAQVTPQVPAYLVAAPSAAINNIAFMEDLHKRLGEVRHDYAQSANIDDKKAELFLRYIGSDLEYKTNLSFEKYGYGFDMRTNAFQLGANFLKVVTDNDDLIRAGLAWTHGSSKIEPDSGYEGYSKTDMTSDNIGLYVTWLKPSGFYVDGVLALNFNDAEVETSLRGKTGTIKSNGWSASVETGYPWTFDNGFVLEPQAQLLYGNLSFDDFIDTDFSKVSYEDKDYLTGRLGLRASRTWETESGAKHTPYARVNYYKTWDSNSDINISNALIAGSSGANFESGKVGDNLQLGLGLTSTVKDGLSFYGEVNYNNELSSAGISGIGGNIGVKWQF